VLQRLDALRARALIERLRLGQASTAHGTANANADADADDTVQAQRASLQWLHRRLQRQADEGEVSASLVETLHDTERQLLEHSRRQRLATPQPAAPALAGLDVAALQAALGAHDAVLVQGRLGDELLACVVRQGGVQVVRQIASFDAVLAAWRLARFQVDALRHGAAPVQAHLATLSRRAQQRLQQLHALVWAPLAVLLEDAHRVLVVPAEGLAGLPFAALHDGLCYLAQRHQLAEAPSAQVALHGLQHAPVAARCLLALGESSRLAHAGDEAKAVAALFNQGQGLGQAYVGEQASLATLLQHAGSADVLHLACHAQFRSDNPMFSALHLHDGPLTAERTESLALRPGVVVLSACETGLAGQAGGDEQVGLVRAFLVAGAARVLASLWPVDDAVTARFMAHFYGALQEGLSPAQALGDAQTALMVQYPHPAFWAGFVLFGGW
jgi:CHAT domain-containing protein